jgi:hypothetical protein
MKVQKKTTEKTDPDLTEKKIIFESVCQCYNQCLTMDEGKYKINKEAKICNKIDTTSVTSQSASDLIQRAINYLIERRYIKPMGDAKQFKYYITLDNTVVKFTWENVKAIKNKEIAELFWLFRKLVVDSLLKSIILNKEVKVYSVGSARITSDYDITLYSNDYNTITDIIKKFQTQFITLFGEDSSIVFDTNVYGKAYIIFECDDCSNEYTKIDLTKCTGQKEQFFYIKSLNDNPGTEDGSKGALKHTQVVWGLIKYLKDLRTFFGESIYNKYFDFLKNKIKNNILDIAHESLIYLNNTTKSYTASIEDEERIKKIYHDNNYNSLFFTNDNISLINFYGVETYFTRGAFLDTVVNSQMCKEEYGNKVIKLYEEDYVASILENAGFFFLHNDKTKYLQRFKQSLVLLSKLDSNYAALLESIYYNELNNVTNEKYDYCKWVDTDDFNILKCEKYEMFQVILKLIYRIIYIYIKNLKTDIEFPFYTIFVNNPQSNRLDPTLHSVWNIASD